MSCLGERRAVHVRNGSKEHTMAIEIGQRYEKIGCYNMVFEVVGFMSTRDGIRHARVVLITDPSDQRTLSEAILVDRDLYRLIRQ